MSTPDYMDFPQPRLSIFRTTGGYYRVEIHGLDSLQNGRYAVMDIGRGSTKESALAQAMDWFNSIEDMTMTPKESP